MWVVLASNRNILSSWLYWLEPQHHWFKTTKHTRTVNLSINSQLWNPQTCSRTETSSSALVRYSLRLLHTHWCYSDKTESISSMLRNTTITTPKGKRKKEKQTESFPIPQMTFTRKAKSPCLLATIIKWCHIIAWERRQNRDGGY